MTIDSLLFHIQFISFDKAIHLGVRPNILEEMYMFPSFFSYSDFLESLQNIKSSLE